MWLKRASQRECSREEWRGQRWLVRGKTSPRPREEGVAVTPG